VACVQVGTGCGESSWRSFLKAKIKPLHAKVACRRPAPGPWRLGRVVWSGVPRWDDEDSVQHSDNSGLADGGVAGGAQSSAGELRASSGRARKASAEHAARGREAQQRTGKQRAAREQQPLVWTRPIAPWDWEVAADWCWDCGDDFYGV